MDRFSTSFSSKSTYFSSVWPRHGAIRAAFGTIQAVTSCGPLRTVEQSPRKRESGSFHENRPLLLAIRELPLPDPCARLAPISPTPVCGQLKFSLKELWIEDQLEFMRLSRFSTPVPSPAVAPWPWPRCSLNVAGGTTTRCGHTDRSVIDPRPPRRPSASDAEKSNITAGTVSGGRSTYYRKSTHLIRSELRTINRPSASAGNARVVPSRILWRANS